jgi:hypothetical protein
VSYRPRKQKARPFIHRPDDPEKDPTVSFESLSYSADLFIKWSLRLFVKQDNKWEIYVLVCVGLVPGRPLHGDPTSDEIGDGVGSLLRPVATISSLAPTRCGMVSNGIKAVASRGGLLGKAGKETISE